MVPTVDACHPEAPSSHLTISFVTCLVFPGWARLGQVLNASHSGFSLLMPRIQALCTNWDTENVISRVRGD